MGKEIEATLNAAYLLDDKRHCDMTSYIDLAVPDCTIRQAVKGVVTDKARGVFQGKFHVRKPCLLYTSPSPRDQRGSRMPSSA